MSSSNRTTLPCEAAVYRNEKPIGPLRLPAKNKDAFVKNFNRLYEGTGIAIETVVDFADGNGGEVDS